MRAFREIVGNQASITLAQGWNWSRQRRLTIVGEAGCGKRMLCDAMIAAKGGATPVINLDSLTTSFQGGTLEELYEALEAQVQGETRVKKHICVFYFDRITDINKFKLIVDYMHKNQCVMIVLTDEQEKLPTFWTNVSQVLKVQPLSYEEATQLIKKKASDTIGARQIQTIYSCTNGVPERIVQTVEMIQAGTSIEVLGQSLACGGEVSVELKEFCRYLYLPPSKLKEVEFSEILMELTHITSHNPTYVRKALLTAVQTAILHTDNPELQQEYMRRIEILDRSIFATQQGGLKTMLYKIYYQM